MGMRVTQRGLARALDIDVGHINRLVKKGVLVIGTDKMLDVEESRAAIAASRSISHAYLDDVNARQRTTRPPRARATPGVPPPEAAHPDEPQDGPIDTGGGADVRRNYNRARSVRESFSASLLQLEYKRKSGMLVDREVAERILFEAGRSLRDAWMSFPARVAPLLAAELGLSDSDALQVALHRHVVEQVTMLGDGHADFRV